MRLHESCTRSGEERLHIDRESDSTLIPLRSPAVRFREKCTRSGEEDLNAADALPAALDYVLAKAQPPALVLLDGW